MMLHYNADKLTMHELLYSIFFFFFFFYKRSL